jgi:hypothetical protein
MHWCRWLQPLSRKLRVSLGIVMGQFGLPVPKWSPLWTVGGCPIDMGPGMDPAHEDFASLVEEKHQAFTRALISLYESHKGQFFDGRKFWTDRPLIIQ